MEDETFFVSGSVQDERYRLLRDDDFFMISEARQFVESIWSSCRPYLDADFRTKASEHFLARFWEMYLVYSFLENKLGIMPRSARPSAIEGPDVLLADGVTYVEAVLATSGRGPDAVPELCTSLSWVPEDQIRLRFLNAIDEKLKKLLHYRAAGIVHANDRYVIAVSSSGISLGKLEFQVPRIARAVFGLGNEQIHIDIESGRIVGRSWTHQGEVKKILGATVGSRLFLSPESAPISAVMYSYTDECNRPLRPGADFIIVHNPSAENPLPRGFFPFGIEYWVEGDQLKWQKHPRDQHENS